MEEQFVPYELSVKLKILGFDDECFAHYENSNFKMYRIDKFGEVVQNMDGIEIVKAPLWQQAFDWFEDNHELYSSQDNVILDYGIADCRNNDIQIVKTISIDSTYKNREEVRKARLEKLIKLIENETN